MQMLDDAKPARAGRSKKKYGTFLADFEKQLWVGNSEQSSELCSCRSESTSLLGKVPLQSNMCLFEKVLPRVWVFYWRGNVRICAAEPNKLKHLQFSVHSIRV